MDGPTGPSGPTAAPATSVDPGASSGGAAAEDAPGGAGDEEPIRTEAAFAVQGGQVTPASVSVPPFFAVELSVSSKDSAAHQVKLVGTAIAFTLPAGERVVRRLEGLQPGMYALLVDGGAGAGSLVVGDQAGP